MRKLILAAALLTIATVFVTHLIGSNRAAVAKARAEAAALGVARDSLVTVVGKRDSILHALGFQRDTLESLAESWRDSVDVLERNRAANQLTVREVQTISGLEDEFGRAFPELGPPCPPVPPVPPCSAWRLMTVSLAGDTLGLEYLAVPAWFTETFVIDHRNAEFWRAQKDALLAVDSLRDLVGTLQDSAIHLLAANAEAYRAGYQAAYASYQGLSKRYVAELGRPHIAFGSTLRLVAAVGAGFAIGKAAR